jgi:hypothetical protein
LCFTAALLAAEEGASVAHSLAVTTGHVRVVDDRLVIAIDVPPHELEHAGVDPGDDAAAAAHIDRLAAGVVALNDRGAPLGPAHDSPGSRAWTLDDATRYVTLLLQPQTVPGTPLRQVHLRVFCKGAERPSDIARLTGPATAEVLDVQAMRVAASDDVRPVLASDAFRVGRIELNVSADRVEAHVVLPAPLLESWRLSPRTNRDALAAAEIDGCEAALNAWLLAHVQLRLDGLPTTVRALRPRWLRPRDALQSGRRATLCYANTAPPFLAASPRPANKADLPVDSPTATMSNRCFWSARVHLALVADVKQTPSRAELTCSAFNAGVLGLEASVAQDGQVLLAGSLTAYAPQVAWERRSADIVVRVGHREKYIPPSR